MIQGREMWPALWDARPCRTALERALICHWKSIESRAPLLMKTRGKTYRRGRDEKLTYELGAMAVARHIAADADADADRSRPHTWAIFLIFLPLSIALLFLSDCVAAASRWRTTTDSSAAVATRIYRRRRARASRRIASRPCARRYMHQELSACRTYAAPPYTALFFSLVLIHSY